jgi:glycosyltransferase involved in cell wall biosynthesis
LLVANFLSSSEGSRSVMEDLVDRLRTVGERLICVSHYRAGWLRGLHMAATVLWRRGEYDLAVIDLYSGRAFLWGEVVAALLTAMRRPFVLVLRGGALPGFAVRHPGRVKACLRRAAAVTAPSPFLQEQMRAYLPSLNDLILLPNPLDISRYEFKLRTKLQPRLIWLRSLHEIYNPTLAAKVLAKLLPEFPDVHLTMIGPDKGDGSWQRVEQMATELGVSDRLTMTGGVAKRHVPAWLNRGDIFLNTTNIDNTPVSVLEAMACGLCVVSTNVGGIPYLLDDGGDSLLVPPDDAEAMAAAVRRLLTDAELAGTISHNARRKTEKFDFSVVLPQWEELLIEAAKA